MANAAWGIDLGNRALKAIKLVRDGDRIRVDDFEVIEHEQILFMAGDNKESLLQNALATFVERHAVRNTPVAVAVSGQQSFARFIKLPPVETKKIPEIVRFEAIQQIPFTLDDVEWSYQLFQEKDSPDIEVGIFAIKKDLVNRQIGYFTNLRMNVTAVQMHPFAVYNAMYHDERIAGTTMFMDSGAENTDLIIADGQTVWLRTLNIGGNNFTETLAKAFKLSFAKAEELKRNAATSKYAKQIFQAMRPVFSDLVAEIQRSIGFYASVHREARIQKIIAQGSTFQLPGLQKYLQQNLQLPVEKLDNFKAIPPQEARMAASYSENLVSLAGAYGLAIQALGDGKITSSLLPTAIRRAKMWQEKTPKFAAAAALILLGAVGAGARLYVDNYLYAQNESKRGAIENGLRNGQDLASKWKSKIEDSGKRDRSTLLQIRSMADHRELLPSILNDILQRIPASDLARLKAQPDRKLREQILIQGIETRYVPDLREALAAVHDRTDLSRLVVGMRGDGEANYTGEVPRPHDSGGAPVEAQQEAPKRGYFVVVRGITPHKDKGAFVNRVLLERLVKERGMPTPPAADSGAEPAATAPKPAKAPLYYVAAAQLIQEGPRIIPRTPGAAGHGAMGGAGGMGSSAADPADETDYSGGQPLAPTPVGTAGGGGGAGVYNPVVREAAPDANPDKEKDPRDEVDPATLDRLFPGESIVGDTRFAALIVVVVDPTGALDFKKIEE